MDSSIIDYFRKINNIHNTTSKKEVDLYKVKKQIMYDFDDNVLAFLVQVESNDRYLIITDSDKENTKKFISKPDEIVNSGNMVVWDGIHWIVTEIDPNKDIYSKGKIQRCFSSLKWKDSLGAIKEAYFTLAASDQRGLGIEEGKVMTLPSERRYITLQNNADTLKIVKNQRFIFDNNKTWKVVSANTLKTGLISMELEEAAFATELDNLELRIANYTLHNYTIDITNGTSVNLATTGTLQLNVTTKDNGVITDQIPITYTTTNNTIATVNSTGLITCLANGTVTIKAALSNDPSIFVTMSVNVADVVTSGWTLDITGNDYCKVNQIQRFSGTVKNNGVTDTSKLIRWTLYDDSGELPTELAYIISQSGSDVVLKASKQLGHIRLQGTCYAKSNFTVEDIASFTVADLSLLTVDEIAFIGGTNQTSQSMTMQTVNGLFNLSLTVEQMSTLTVDELSAYTVGDLVTESVLVSSVKRVEVRGLI